MKPAAGIALTILAGALAGYVSVGAVVSRHASSAPETGSQWRRNADPASNPYSLVRFTGAGRLAPAGDIEFEAQSDSDGRALDIDCAYRIAIPPIPARWWLLSAGSAGRRGAQYSGTAVAESNGTTVVNLAREVAPGNWIDPGEGSELVLRLTLHAPGRTGGDLESLALPEVRRTSCS